MGLYSNLIGSIWLKGDECRQVTAVDNGRVIYCVCGVDFVFRDPITLWNDWANQAKQIHPLPQ